MRVCCDGLTQVSGLQKSARGGPTVPEFPTNTVQKGNSLIAAWIKYIQTPEKPEKVANKEYIDTPRFRAYRAASCAQWKHHIHMPVRCISAQCRRGISDLYITRPSCGSVSVP